MDLEASKRPSFVARSCDGDPEMQRSFESLLAHSTETGTSFEQAMQEVVDPVESLPTCLDLVGRTLGHYRVVEKIGKGGMGEVYRAADTRLGRDVAIKVLPEGLTQDPELLARFEREARVLASLNHPHIATIYGIEEIDGFRFLVLELLEGETLRSKMGRETLPLNTVIRLAAQVGAGLAKAHEAGIVHRDLKPENLMLTEDGSIKILDFGLAKATVDPKHGRADLKTVTGRIMGTVNYMSPEQARGEALDHRSDQFAFGSVLFEMVIGKRAFSGETDADTLVAIMRSEPERPKDFDDRVPQPLCAVIERCLAKEPEDRFGSTRELTRAFLQLMTLSGEITETEMTGVGPAQTVPLRAPLIAAFSVVLVVVTAVVLWWLFRDGAQEEAVAHGEVTSSIAVLPFANLGPPEEEYFADGMTDALITHLSKIEALKVISRISVMRYKGAQLPLPEIARELGVETILTGSVLHAGGRVRISTQLIEVGTDRNVWADSYEKDLGDILTLQGEVARAIAGAVQVEIDPEVGTRLATSRTVDPKAYEVYLRGLADLDDAAHGRFRQRGSILATFGKFQRAIELEPEWAEPRAKLAVAYRWLASLEGPDGQAEYFPKAKAAALRALELDDTVADAHLALGAVLLNHEWKWGAAEQSYLRGIEFDPNGANWNYAQFLVKAGRYDQAIEQFKWARERFPTSPLVSRHQGEAFLCSGQHLDVNPMSK